MSSSSNLRPARELALIAMFAGITAALGLVPAWAPFGLAVPVTAQSIGPMLAGSIIGARRGFAAMILLIVLIAVGLPLLAGGRGGIGVFAGPSVGYLVGWPLAALVVGAIIARELPRYRLPVGLLANLVGGILVVYLVGVPVMAWRGDIPLDAAFIAGLAFLPGDVVKMVVATLVAKGVHAAYPRFAEEARERRDLAAGRR